MPATLSCPTCFKIFKRRSDLNRHQHLHTGYKPHVCEKCGKAFAQFTGLKTHRNVHTKERPFKCSVCFVSFSDPSSCARHLRETHMNPGGHKCSYPGCKTSIKRRSCFVKHMKEKHGVDLTKIKVETDLPELDDGGLYQISYPEDSASPSESDSSFDDNQWRGQPIIQGTVPEQTIGYDVSIPLADPSFTASSDCVSMPYGSAALGIPVIPLLSLTQLDQLASSLMIDTSTYVPTYEYPQWAGTPFTPSSSECSSLSSSPEPVTPEHLSSDSMSEVSDSHYAHLIPVQDVLQCLHYSYSPLDFSAHPSN